MINSTYYTHLTIHGYEPSYKLARSNMLINLAAEKLGIEVIIHQGTRLVEYRYKDITRFSEGQVPQQTSWPAYYATMDKSATKALLQTAGITVPRGIDIRSNQSRDYIIQAFEQLQKPIVVKRTHCNQGKGVFTEVNDPVTAHEHATTIFNQLVDSYEGVIFEQQHDLPEYRLVATPDTFIGGFKRIPAHVVGDNKHNVEELIVLENTRPERKTDVFSSLSPIVIDEVVTNYLNQQQMSLKTVPGDNQKVQLRGNSNLSTGGTYQIMTDHFDESVKSLARAAVAAIPNLAIGGVDLLSADVTISQQQVESYVIEVNASPSLYTLDDPWTGANHFQAVHFLCVLFPEFASELWSKRNLYDPTQLND